MFILKRDKAMEVSKETCESRLLVNRGFKGIIFASNVYIEKRKGGVRFGFTCKPNVGVLMVKIIKKLGNLVSRLENEETIINITTI